MPVLTQAIERIHRGRVLCRVAYGVTCYFKEPPTRDEVMRAYEVYRAFCPRERRTLISTVRQPQFVALDRDDRHHVYRSLIDQDRRRDEGVVVWDGRPGAQWTFWMQGYVPPDPDSIAASFCQIFVPEDVDCDVLAAIARGLGNETPLLSGHGGYTVQFDGSLKGRAFNQIYAWSKRFWGLDVEDLNVTLPYVRESIKGVNWVTLVGHELWRKLSEAVRDLDDLPSNVTIETLQHARLVTGGVRPTLADRNRQEFPHLYAAVERMLEPIKVRAHGEFAGRFEEARETQAWLHRFLEPSAW